MNAQSGEFEVRLNCGSHAQPAVGGTLDPLTVPDGGLYYSR